MKKGSCHCGAVQFEADLQSDQAITCNCSICQKKGTVLTMLSASQFSLKSGKDKLTDYLFGKKKIHHFFCKVCGVSCFSEGIAPNGEKMVAVNARCLEDFDFSQFKIHNYDGRSIPIE